MKSLAIILFLFGLGANAQDLLPPEMAFQPSAHYVDAKTIELRYAIAPGYYLYRDKFVFTTASAALQIAKAQFPKGKIKKDPFFGRVEIYRDTVAIRLPVTAVSEGVLLNTTSQGCADVGICYPPMTQRILVMQP